MTDLTDALAQLRAEADPVQAAETTESLKTTRDVLGLKVPRITELAQGWRQEMSLDDRIALADGLWQSDIHEARIAAAKLLVQARIRPDEDAWALITAWVPQCDTWALADPVAEAGSRRLVAEPSRLDALEAWTTSKHMWTRRAALAFTMPWAKLSNPKAAELEARERILGWAATLVADGNWFVQKAIAIWIRDLAKHDRARAEAFLAAEGAGLKSFAQKVARTYIA